MKFKVTLLAGDESLLSGPLPDQAELKDLPERSRGLNPTQVLGTYRSSFAEKEVGDRHENIID